MAHHWIGRDDDHHSGKLETPTDDEDEGPEETSSSYFVSKQPLETPITYPPVATTISTNVPTSSSYSSKMSEGPQGDDSGRPTSYPYQGPRPTGPPPPGPPTSGPLQVSPPWENDNSYRGPPSSTTFETAYGGNNGLASSTASTKPTGPLADTSAPPSTDDGPSGSQNDAADNGPNRAPMYAAAGVVPVVVIVVGFLIFFFLRKRRRQRSAVEYAHNEEMKMRPKSVAMPYLAPITPPSPPPQAALPQYTPSPTTSTPTSSQPPTASSSQPVILGPIPSGNNGAYLTGMDTSDLVSMTSAGGVSRQGTVVDRDPFADGRSLEEAPPPYRPSSLPPVSVASTSRNSSVRTASTARMTSRTQLMERSPFEDPEDDEVSEISGPTYGRGTDAMSNVSELSYQIDPFASRRD